MSQEEEYEEDFAAKYDGVFAGEADGDDDESEGDDEDYGDEFEGAEPAMPDPVSYTHLTLPTILRV